jgi:adenylate cyclase
VAVAGNPGRAGKKWWSRLGNAPMWAAAIATLFCSCIYSAHHAEMMRVPGLDGLELMSIDARFRLRGERPQKGDDIVIIGVDDATRTLNPEVFQTRRGWAKLIDALAAKNPRAIALDIMFTSPELALSKNLVTMVMDAHELMSSETEARTPGAQAAFEALQAVVAETRGDEQLAQSIANAGNVFLGSMFAMPKKGDEPAEVGVYEPIGIATARFGEAVAVKQPESRRPPAAEWVAATMTSMAKNAAGGGALNVVIDDDGKIRRVYGVLTYGGRFYMPLGLSMALAEMGGGADASYVVGDETLRAGDHTLPVNPRGQMRISFLGPGKTAFPHVSAAAIIDAPTTSAIPTEADREQLEENQDLDLTDKLLFVGFTDSGRDKVATPFDTIMDGVEVHATVAHNILNDELMTSSSQNFGLLVIAILGGLLTVLQLRRIRRRRSWVAGAAAMGVIAAYLILAHVLFSTQHVIVEVAAPSISCVFVTLCSMVAALATEGREKRQLKSAFSQYVNDTLVDQILMDPPQLGGERRELTVLFSDIRGFSAFSERLEPEVLSEFLNEYLTPMTDLVMTDGGMLDKYIGDAVMAVYGAPRPPGAAEIMVDHAERACRTALAMLEELIVLNEAWKKKGLPEIAIGIGVNSGPMSVGHMGSDRKFDYTVLGDAVNLGARLEGLTKEYQVDILAGEATALAAGSAFAFRELDLVQVMGRSGVARIFELVGEADDRPFSDEDLHTFHGALAAYRDQEWDAAEAGFSAFLEAHPEDGPARVMLERIADLREKAPGDDWDGVFAALFK